MFKNQDLWVSHLMLARINYVKIIHLLHHWIYQIEIHDLYLKLIDAILRQKKSSSKISSEKLICSSWYLSSRNWPVIEYDHRDGLAEHSLAHFCIKYDQGLVWFGHSSACWCIKYDPLPSLLTLINSTVWSLYSLLTWLADLLFGIWTSNNMVLKSCFGKSTSHDYDVCQIVLVVLRSQLKRQAFHDILQESWISAQWRLPRSV